MTSATDRSEFQRMVIISVTLHGILFSIAMIGAQKGHSRLFEKPSTSVNVLWATAASKPAGKKTPEWKLPGPVVRPKKAAAPKSQKPKLLKKKASSSKTKKEKKAKANEKENAADEARRKAMAQALAQIQKNDEDRPAPRADNFPSAGEGSVGGSSGLGAIAANPIFARYKDEIRQAIIQNFIWIQRNRPQAEVSFRIDPNGNILEPNISKESGNAAYDRAALRAVEKSSPLPAPPTQIAKDLIREEFVIRFDKEMK